MALAVTPEIASSIRWTLSDSLVEPDVRRPLPRASGRLVGRQESRTDRRLDDRDLGSFLRPVFA